jgi:hypothetical protein
MNIALVWDMGPEVSMLTDASEEGITFSFSAENEPSKKPPCKG